MIVKTRTSVKYKGVWYKAHEVLEIGNADFIEKAFEKVQTKAKPLKPANINDDKNKEPESEPEEKKEDIKEKINNLKRQELLSELKERNIPFAVTEPNEDLKKRLLNNW